MHRRSLRIGGALFEVTQPRVTCYRVGIRMDESRMAALLVAHDRPGFYFRVIEEGEVGDGDEIVKVADGPERMTVAGVNALLYKPPHPKSGLERALRIPALSAGWRRSLRTLFERAEASGAATGNPGLAPAGPPPAWQGFRPLGVTRKDRESRSVTSLILEPADGKPLAAALPGQFIVLRLKPAPTAPVLLRSYSLSGEPGETCYRISVKREAHGAAGAYIETEVRVGDMLEAARHAEFYARVRRRPCRPCGRRRRSNSPAGDAPCLGRSCVDARDLVDLRHPRRRRAPVRCGDANAAWSSSAQQKPHPLQRAGSGRPTGCRFRCSRTLEHRCAEGIGSAARCRLLSLWTARLLKRIHHRAQNLGCRLRSRAQRDFRIGSVQDAGYGRGSEATAAPARGSSRHRAAVSFARATSAFAGLLHFRTCSTSPRRAMSP